MAHIVLPGRKIRRCDCRHEVRCCYKTYTSVVNYHDIRAQEDSSYNKILIESLTSFLLDLSGGMMSDFVCK
jgi:hypothetical protein